MHTARFRSVDEYIASQSEPTQKILARVRSVIRRAVPDAAESISYNLPTYKLHGRPVIYFAAWKNHYSVYPSTAALVAKFKDELSRYEMSKGTIRFPLNEPVPARLIAGIAKFRAAEVAQRGRTGSA
jgi:uncharacterized protein YdhG (YjbR/CyaY superfamily)